MNLIESIRKAIKEQCFPNPNAPPTFGNYGCMDPVATNYDQFATHPCNSYGPSNACADCQGNSDYCGPGTSPGDCCTYPPPIYGCTDLTACNYDVTANTDDGSCEYTSCLGCTDQTANNYDVSATIDDGSCTYVVPGCTDQTANNYDPNATIDDGCSYCKEPTNVSSYGNTSQLYIGINWDVPVYPTSIPPLSATVNKFKIKWREQGIPPWNSTVITSIGSGLSDSHTITTGLINNATYEIKIRSICDNTKSAWVTTTQATATQDLGCTDPGACNYDGSANTDDGSCEYVSCAGCTDPTAINYDSSATIACVNCCVYPIDGCTDPLGLNYDPLATVDDGSCVYQEEPKNCTNELDLGCWVCKDPINFPGCQQLSNMNQVTMATGYGLQGFDNQQDCVSNTECGGGDADGPCKDINGYILSTYPNYQGGGPLDFIHFCEKCMSGEITDPMCKCCKKDPCNKKYLEPRIQNDYGIMINEFCKYCKYEMIDDPSCKCCRRFDKLNKKRLK